ncbi:MAG: alpha/beta hydrolase [Desulfocucumaceae bacterium]
MKSISFLNGRGQKLSGLLSPGPVQERSAVVIVCHGFSGSKEGQGMAVDMAQFLAKNGFSSFLFDFAGCGESEGKFEDITLSGQIDDLKSAVDFCLDMGFSSAITQGRSFGGTTALCHGASDSRIKGVCTWAAPASLSDLYRPDNAFCQQLRLSYFPPSPASDTGHQGQCGASGRGLINI